MALNHYVTMGRSGLAVSPLCLGAMTFGEDLGWGASEAESKRIIDRYLDGGGNFIDTANFYTRGHSEKILGDHLGRNAARRQGVVLATKFFCNLYPGDPNAGGGYPRCRKPGSGAHPEVGGARAVRLGTTPPAGVVVSPMRGTHDPNRGAPLVPGIL